MKKKIKKTIEVCDFCGRESVLKHCLICNKEFCGLCVGYRSNAFDQPICKVCIQRDDVHTVLAKGVEHFHKWRDGQKGELIVLPKMEKKPPNQKGR